jgi:hypothetical protein
MKSFQNRFSTFVHCCIKPMMISVLVLLFLFSCKDDTDEISPKIFINEPSENEQFLTVDTFIVSADISDNEQLTFVEMDIVDENFKSVGASENFPISGTQKNFAAVFELNKPLLTSGQYYLRLKAGDGTNQKSAFQQINLSAIPRTIEQYVAVTTSVNNARVYAGENISAWQEKLSISTDFEGAALNYRQNILGIAGGEIGDALFFGTDSFSAQGTIQGFGMPSLPYFLNIKYSSEAGQFLLLDREPRMRILDENAAPKFAAELVSGFLPEDAFYNQERYYVSQAEVTTPFYLLSVYAQSGLLFNSYELDGPVRGAFLKDEDEKYIWIDRLEGAALQLLNTDNELFSEVYFRPGEALNAVAEIENGLFIISTSEGMYRYNYSNGGTVILNSISAEQLLYDDLDGVIYGWAGSTLWRMSLSGQVIQNHNFANDVGGFFIDYNW